MPLGAEVGLGQDDIALYATQLFSPQKVGGTAAHPLFGPCLLWPNGWMDQDVTWYGGPDHIVLDGDPAPPKRGTTAPHFWSMSIVAMKRLDGSRCQCHLVRM